MWELMESDAILRAVARHQIPKEILERYNAWRLIAQRHGPLGLRRMKGLHDEALKGPLKGLRSSRLNIQWRVIYRVESRRVLIHDVQPHTYRR